MKLHDPAAAARARAPKTTRNRKAQTMPAPKPRDFRKAPANPLQLRAMSPDEEAAQEAREPRIAAIDNAELEAGVDPDEFVTPKLAARLNAERVLVLTNAEVAALAVITNAAYRSPGMVSDDARPYVTGALLKLARTLSSV